jgi:transcriptional regulator with XRE-family HTH domain
MRTASPGERLRRARDLAGHSQSELAQLAGVSRALVSAVEQDRHLPAVDAALRLARALGTDAESLFGADERVSAKSALGEPLADGRLVRAATVGDRVLSAPLDPPEGGAAWAAADAIVEQGSLELLPGGSTDGALILGCDPALGTVEALSDGRGPARLVTVPATTGQALESLRSGTCHAALVHGRPGRLARPPRPVIRWHVARWDVGIGYHPRLGHSSLESLLSGQVELVRRQRSAASDQALVRAARRLGMNAPAGPLARGHLDGAQRADWARAAAITYRPAAQRFALNFEPLETHEVELWVAEEWSAHPGIAHFLELIASRAFQARVGAIDGYDLSGSGTRCAA